MIGQPGLGKSEFWAQGDKTFFIDTEGNIEHLSVYKLPCRSWDDFRDIFTALIQQKTKGAFPYDTIVIDTLDRFLDYATEEVVSRATSKYASAIKKGLEIHGIGDIPEGNGWRWQKELVVSALSKLKSDLGCAVVLIGHVQDRTIEDPNKKYVKADLNVGGQLGVMLKGWSNHTVNVEGIMNGQTITRIVWTKPSQSREAKSHGAIVPDGWKWVDAMPENYTKLRKLFT